MEVECGQGVAARACIDLCAHQLVILLREQMGQVLAGTKGRDPLAPGLPGLAAGLSLA